MATEANNGAAVSVNDLSLRNLTWTEYNNKYWEVEAGMGAGHKMGDIFPESAWTKGKEIVSSPFYQVFRMSTTWAGLSDEVLNSTFNQKDSEGNVAFSYYEILDQDFQYGQSLVVKFHVNPYMKEKFGKSAQVSYMGVEHDLAWLEKGHDVEITKVEKKEGEEEKVTETIVQALEFDIQGREHRVTIHWFPGVEESFLIQRIPFPEAPKKDGGSSEEK